MFYNNPIYNFLLERKSSTEISFIPESLWVGDPDNGKKIVDGFMNFNGESIVFDKQTWKKTKVVEVGMKNFSALIGLKMSKH